MMTEVTIEIIVGLMHAYVFVSVCQLWDTAECSCPSLSGPGVAQVKKKGGKVLINRKEIEWDHA